MKARRLHQWFAKTFPIVLLVGVFVWSGFNSIQAQECLAFNANTIFFYEDGAPIEISITIVPDDPPGPCNPDLGCVLPVDYVLEYTGPGMSGIVDSDMDFPMTTYTFTINPSSQYYGDGNFTFTATIPGGGNCDCCDDDYEFNFSTQETDPIECYSVGFSGAPGGQISRCEDENFSVTANLSGISTPMGCGNCDNAYTYQLFKMGNASPVDQEIETNNTSASLGLSGLQTSDAGNYFIVVLPDVDDNCPVNCPPCAADTSATFELVVSESPGEINFSPSSALINCDNDEVTITGISSGATSYEWQGTTNMTNTITVGEGDGGTLTLIASNGECTTNGQVNVVENFATPTPEIRANGSGVPPNPLTITCDIGSVLLNGTFSDDGNGSPSDDPLSYTWTDPNGNVVGMDETFEININSTPGIYELAVTNLESMCPGSMTATLEIIIDADPPTAVLTASSDVITCMMAEVQLSGQGSTYDPDRDIASLSLDGGGNTDFSSLNISVDEPGTYTMTIERDNGCVSEDELIITEDTEEPDLGLDPNEDFLSFCLNESASITASSSTPNVSFSWNTGGDTPELPVPTTDTTAANMPAEYTVTATDNNNGCESEQTVMVEVLSSPLIELASESTGFPKGEPIEIQLSSPSLNSTVNWMVDMLENVALGSLLEMGIDDPTIDGTVELIDDRVFGSISFKAWATNDLDCPSDTIDIRVDISPKEDDCSFYIPKLVTPNGDNQSDTWNIVLPVGDSADAYSIKIYDRAGCVVYESDSLAEAIEAVNCPDGVYYYVISPVVGEACSSEVIRGSLTILGNQQ